MNARFFIPSYQYDFIILKKSLTLNFNFKQSISMSASTKSTLKLIAIVIVLLMVAMQLNFIIIPFLAPYKFWLMVIAAVLLLLAS